MNKLLWILVALALCTGVSCESKSGQVVEPSREDPKLSGPPSWADQPPNPDIIRDQRKVAAELGQAAAAAPVAPRPAATPAPAPAPAAAGPAVAEVQQVVAKMIATVTPGNEQKFAEFLAPKEAELLAPVLKDTLAVAAKFKELEKLAKDKLGAELPDNLKAGQATVSLPGRGGSEDFSQLKFDSLQFAQQGQDVLVTGPQGMKLLFGKVGQEWKIKLPDQDQAAMKALMPVLGELVAATGTFVDAMTAGINDGSIIKDNFDAKAEELGKTHIEPVIQKVFGAMMQSVQPTTQPEPPMPLEPPAPLPSPSRLERP